MKDLVVTVVVLISIFVVLPFVVLWARDRLFFQRSRDRLEADSNRFLARLRSPHLDALEAHFGSRLPSSLRDLYANPDEVMLTDMEVVPSSGADPIYICFYNPADGEDLPNPWPGCERYFAFADDGSGNELMVDPTLDDPPVLWHDHETGEIKTVAPRMSEFMKWARRPAVE
jgi:hypothetical protein